MKLKIFLLTLVLTGIMYLAADYLFLRYTRANFIESAKNSVSQSVSLYQYIHRADSFASIKNVELHAKKPELVAAFDFEKWDAVIQQSPKDFSKLSEESKKIVKNIEQNVQVELNVINKMYDSNDALFVVDRHGNVVAKNLDGIFRNKNLAEELLIKTVLQGFSDTDVIKILDKTYLVTAAPIEKNGHIIGAYCSADNVNSETAKEASTSLYNESLFKDNSRFYFGFFDKQSLLGSTLSTELHESFKKFIADNQELIKKIDTEGSKHDIMIELKNEQFFSSISRHPSLSETNDMFYIALVSKDKLLDPVQARHGTFGLISFFMILVSFIFSFIIDEQFNKPINKFMENMLEIINGNTKFRFSNDAEGVEGNLNQNANMMIATLLGEKSPDKEKLDPDQ
ncbi:MAG TPA: hypothetical protein PLX56_00800 [bacterium]|nr:hypothetical protein [bacterium]